MHLFSNVKRLFWGFRVAVRAPEVQGVLALTLALISVATIFYWFVEGWSLLDSAYFSVVTIATVGYGDFAPQTGIGKLFTIFYIICGIGIFVAAAGAIANVVLRAGTETDSA